MASRRGLSCGRWPSARGDCVAHAEAAEPAPALTEALDKLERMLAGDAGARKHTKHHPRDIDVPSSLPKV